MCVCCVFIVVWCAAWCDAGVPSIHAFRDTIIRYALYVLLLWLLFIFQVDILCVPWQSTCCLRFVVSPIARVILMRLWDSLNTIIYTLNTLSFRIGFFFWYLPGNLNVMVVWLLTICDWHSSVPSEWNFACFSLVSCSFISASNTTHVGWAIVGPCHFFQFLM